MRPLPLLVAVLLGGCQAYPALVPAPVTLQLQPRVLRAGRQVQAAVTPYDAAAIQRLELALYEVDGGGGTTPALDADGQALVTTVTRDDVAHTTVADAHASVVGLAADHTYRIVATAYADDGTVISAEGSGSQTDVAVPAGIQEATTVAAAVRVQLVDHVFEGQATYTGITGSFHVIGGNLNSVQGANGL